eukprot:1396868-Rhodomonas_salina.1
MLCSISTAPCIPPRPPRSTRARRVVSSEADTTPRGPSHRVDRRSPRRSRSFLTILERFCTTGKTESAETETGLRAHAHKQQTKTNEVFESEPDLKDPPSSAPCFQTPRYCPGPASDGERGAVGREDERGRRLHVLVEVEGVPEVLHLEALRVDQRRKRLGHRRQRRLLPVGLVARHHHHPPAPARRRADHGQVHLLAPRAPERLVWRDHRDPRSLRFVELRVPEANLFVGVQRST